MADTVAPTATTTTTGQQAKPAATALAVSAKAKANPAPVISGVALSGPNAATGAVTGKISASDPNDRRLRFKAATSATGTVSVTPTRWSTKGATFTFTPTLDARHAAAQIGAETSQSTVTVTVTVTDRRGASTTQTVMVPISPKNATPVAGTPVVGAPDAATGVVAGSVSGTDADGDTLTFSGTTTTAKGAVTVNSNGFFTYTPAASARHAAAKVGAGTSDTTDTFTVSVNDGHGGSVAVPVSVTVAPSNSVPVAGAPVVGAPNVSSGVVNGKVSATDADRDALTYSGSTTTGKGTVVVNPDGSFTYTPTADAQRNAYLPGAPASDLSDTFTATVTDGYGGSISVPVKVSVNPSVSYYVTGDVRRDPVTGRIALRTTFPPEQEQPGTGIPGYLNWLIGTSNTGALIGFPADVQNWDNLYLVGSTVKTTPFNPAADYAENTVLRNPLTGAVAIRTIFPEDQGPNLANMAWLVATTSQGALHVPTSSVRTWEVLSASNRAPVAGTPAVGTPNALTGVVTGSVSATDSDGDSLTYSGSTTTSKGSVTVADNGSFTYTPIVTARQNAGKTGATAADKTDNFIVTVTDGNGGTASVPVEVVVRSLLKTGDIIRQPGGTWRAIYMPNMTTSGNWLAVIPDNGGAWLNDSDVSGWLDVPPPTGTETAGEGPYLAGDIKVPPGSVEGSVTWFAVKTGPPLSNIRSWVACGVGSACNPTSDNEVFQGSPIAQWVDLKLSK